MKPIIIKTNPPIMVDNFPNNLFNLFPNIKPKYVNIKLQILKIKAHKYVFLLIAFNPMPTDRLSTLTAKPNNSNCDSEINFSVFVSLKLSINI